VPLRRAENHEVEVMPVVRLKTEGQEVALAFTCSPDSVFRIRSPIIYQHGKCPFALKSGIVGNGAFRITVICGQETYRTTLLIIACFGDNIDGTADGRDC